MSILGQSVLNAILSGTQFALIGLSFALAFRTWRVFSIAHAGILTLGAYLALIVSRSVDVPAAADVLVGTLMGAVPVTIALGALYSLLLRAGVARESMLVGSLGIYWVIENGVACVFGDRLQSLQTLLVAESYSVLGGQVTGPQVVSLVTASAAIAATFFWLRLTHVGVEVRAIADDEVLSSLRGVSPARVRAVTMLASTALGLLAGGLLATTVDFNPLHGFRPLLFGYIAMAIGGPTLVGGVLMGAYSLSVAQQTTAALLGDQWIDAASYSLLVLWLVIADTRQRRLG